MNLRKALWLINMLIACLIVWQGAEIAFTWTSKRDGVLPDVRGRSDASVPNPALDGRKKDFSEFRSIVEHDVFKTAEAGQKEKTEPEPVAEIEVTKLDLTLKGTVLGENEPSFAVIENGKGKGEGLYYLKDFVQGAQILKILSDRVILSVDGKEEALIMKAERESAPRIRQPFTRSLPQRRIVQRRPPVKINPFVNRSTNQEPKDIDEEEPPEPDVGESEG